MSDVALDFHGPPAAASLLLLAHGAGAGCQSDFMQSMAAGLATAGCRVGLFDFPYMQRATEEQRRRPPDRQPRLLECWQLVLDQVKLKVNQRLIIGGKSMGGRMASLLFEESTAAGLLCLGYPFHPAGKPEKQRVEHLTAIRKSVLIVQGDRDPLGNREDVESYSLPSHFQVRWLADGDHSFKPRLKSGWSEQQHRQQAIQWIVAWADRLG